MGDGARGSGSKMYMGGETTWLGSDRFSRDGLDRAGTKAYNNRAACTRQLVTVKHIHVKCTCICVHVVYANGTHNYA